MGLKGFMQVDYGGAFSALWCRVVWHELKSVYVLGRSNKDGFARHKNQLNDVKTLGRFLRTSAETILLWKKFARNLFAPPVIFPKNLHQQSDSKK